ncbi:hypothetical protein LAC81_34580 (plasmid) [Ensifer adhaerens]|uniref:hypothetical protein n=1 Tax=Ensifer adhaerens TaxID=106592 RepID=UPI001CBEB3DE|nr:hypothetical protein [Ensifer adhaerens]MBZ7927086.1 hypothetical protein [Ensifer adhaerens]UAX98131.1 hypothetical protein LAC78_35880 [Ensifer adhaerens]UAY05512.1 hypothetical protein LAC80_34585 [Ensifer adhaerens]UAY12890.1 hypothetical protein LAC81_34580 [Ensifer adhaerens]
MNAILLTAVSPVKASSGQGLPPIRQLFGVELGANVGQYQAVGEAVMEAELNAPEWVQRIVPPEPNSLFSQYEVLFNSETREIYQVRAQSTLSRIKCEATVHILSGVLKKKYEGYDFLELEGHFAVDDGSSSIMPSYQLVCTGGKMLMWLIDVEAHGLHVKQNKDRSPVSTNGL